MDELNHKDEKFPFLSPGTVIAGKYEILNVIGQGGCGRVYKGRYKKNHDQILAVKEIYYSSSPDSEIMNVSENFRRESSILSSLTHPNIPRVIDYFIDGARYYIVMDYVSGKTLQDKYKIEERRWKEEELVTFAIEICDVLEYLHSKSVIFRDLKARNIIIDEDGTPKLIDFGIARYFKPEQTQDTISIGTIGYAAPEQYGQKGGGSDSRTDIYGLGVILHYLSTGDDPEEKQDPFSFTPVNNMSKEFREIIHKCIALRKDDRFTSVKELKKKLEKKCKAPGFAIEKHREGRVKKKSGEKYYPVSPPESSGIICERTGEDKFIINIPPGAISIDIATPILCPMFSWACCTFFGLLFILDIIKKGTSWFFAIPWLIGECALSIKVICSLTSILGHVILSFDREYMKIKIFWLGFLPVERKYSIDKLSNVIYEEEIKGINNPDNTADSLIYARQEFWRELEYKNNMGLLDSINIKYGNKNVNIPVNRSKEVNIWISREIRNILKYLRAKPEEK